MSLFVCEVLSLPWYRERYAFASRFVALELNTERKKSRSSSFWCCFGEIRGSLAVLLEFFVLASLYRRVWLKHLRHVVLWLLDKDQSFAHRYD